MANEYKPNSHKSKEDEKKKVESVVKGRVKTKKKSEVRKFADVFIPEDMANVKQYIVSEVIVPAIKKTISEIVDMFLYPDGSGRKRSSTNSRVSYTNYYDRRDDRARVVAPRGGYQYDDIIFDNRGEAEEVLEKMDELIETYGVVSVGDLYDLVGISNQSSYTDQKYGWTNIRTAQVVRLRDGYMIKLPKVLPID